MLHRRHVQFTLEDRTLMDNHFVKVNSTDFAQAPILFYSIISLEIFLNAVLLTCMPFVFISFLRTGVMHRNFRMQVCCAFVYFMFQIYCRFILLYYELNDIPNRRSDILLFWVETIRNAIIGTLCAMAGSFAFERLIATHFWPWYEKGSSSTLWVLVFVQFANVAPAILIAWLCYTDRISIVVNLFAYGLILVVGLVLFIAIYLKNVRILKELGRGASINSYSLSRTFQVQENVELMTYMYKLAIPAAISSSVAVIGFSVKLFAPKEWKLLGDIAYAFFDLGIVIVGITCTVFAIIGNDRIYYEFKKVYPMSILFAIKDHRSRQRIATISIRVETDSYFSQLQHSWA